MKRKSKEEIRRKGGKGGRGGMKAEEDRKKKHPLGRALTPAW